MTGHSLGGCFVSSLWGATSLIGAILSFLSILVLNSPVNKDRKPCVIQYSYIVDKKRELILNENMLTDICRFSVVRVLLIAAGMLSFIDSQQRWKIKRSTLIHGE